MLTTFCHFIGMLICVSIVGAVVYYVILVASRPSPINQEENAHTGKSVLPDKTQTKQ